MDKDYIRSERFIHDELLLRCVPLVAKVRELWRRNKRIYPTILLWPTDSVKTTAGEKFTGVVFDALKEEGAARREEIQRAAAACGAYAVLITEQLETDVRMVFESVHGSRTWRLPIKEHGDVQVLGQATVRDDAESVGVLWFTN